MMKQLSLVLFALAGCTMMVNGKPRTIGGSDPAPEAQAAAPGDATPREATPLAPGQVVKVTDAIGRDPLVMATTAVFDTSWSKVFGFNSRSPDCGLEITSQPVAAFEITKADRDLNVALVGAANDGFVVRKGDQFWTSCDPTMTPMAEGWAPGRYSVYPLARYGHGGTKRFPYQLELFRPNAPIVEDKAQKLVIAGKLDRPMIVEVQLAATRRKLREKHSGNSCEPYALSPTPDLALMIERPVPGLTIRPLPSATPITVRIEKPGDGKNRAAQKYCVRSSSSHGTSYRAESELHFDTQDEGAFGISFGTPQADDTKVTLMIFDASTKLDEMTVRPFGGESPTLEQRWIAYQMPQLETKSLGMQGRYADLERDARVFAAVPKQAFVYAKLTFDKDIGGGDGYPVKNEPLVLLDLERERATVMTADGLRFNVKASHVVLAPDGPVELPKVARGDHKRDISATIAMLPPAQKKLGDAQAAKVSAREACIERAWEPYRRQLPSYSRPAGVDIVVYKSARTKNIEEAGDRAVIAKCGSREAFEKQTEATRVKLAAEVEKGRTKLLGEATAGWRASD